MQKSSNEESPARNARTEAVKEALTRSRGGRYDAQHAFELAARSVLESQVLEGTVAGLVDQRALDHHYRGLLQFAALRVGSVAARTLVNELEQSMDDLLLDLASGVSVKARLYRRLAQRIAELPASPPSRAYWSPEDSVYRSELDVLRNALSGPLRDPAELAYARRLSPSEIAYVLDRPRVRVDAELDAVVAIANQRVGLRPRSSDGTSTSAIAEAFALDFKRAELDPRRTRLPVLQPGMTIGDRYEIETLLGSGSFADVYRARDRDVPDHVVALKILRHRARDDSAERRALRELQLIASVFHPSVVQLKDHGWYESRLWFVMPLYSGETLAQRLARGPLSRRKAREIFEPLAEALATMHRAGVRHQDVKPENVFLARLTTRPEAEDAPVLPILLDLGVAAKDAELVLAGTPLYFAPEVAARFAGVPDPAPVGPKADVFSLALTLVHALDPHEREALPAIAVDAFVAMRARKAPTLPRTRSMKDLAPHLARWLNTSPDERPTSEEFRHELRYLTARDELRARRIAALRWLVPSVVGLVVLFSAMVYALSRENALQRAEAAMARAQAERAGREAESAYESFTHEEQRRRALEDDVRGLQQVNQNNRMTRDELAEQLAGTRLERDAVLERERLLLVRLRQDADALREMREQQTALKVDHLALVQQRAEALTEVERQRTQRGAMEAELMRARERLGDVERALEQSRLRTDALERQIKAMRAPYGIPRSPALKGEAP